MEEVIVAVAAVVHRMTDQVAVGKTDIRAILENIILCFVSSFRCNQSGHFARDCPSDSNQVICYNCNQPGYTVLNQFTVCHNE